jgi:hypothetical protein
VQVGDLATFRFGNRLGVIVEDHTMMCSHAGYKPYLCGAMMVYTGGKIERVVYADLRLVNESR